MLDLTETSFFRLSTVRQWADLGIFGGREEHRRCENRGAGGGNIHNLNA